MWIGIQVKRRGHADLNSGEEEEPCGFEFRRGGGAMWILAHKN